MKLTNKLKRFLNTPINGEQFYLGCFAFYLFSAFLQNTTFNFYITSRPFNLIAYEITILLLFKIYFLDSYDLKSKSLIALIMLIAIVSWRQSHSNLVMVMAAFILGAQGVSFRQIIKYYFYISLIMFGMVVFYSLIGVIKNLIFVVHGRATRYALGIVYPTDLGARVLYLILAYSYLNFKKLNVKTYLCYFLIAVLLKLITDARLNVICILLSIPILYVAQRAQKGKSLSQVLASFYWVFTPIIAFLMVILSYFYDEGNRLYRVLDHILSGRLFYSNVAFNRYPVTLFGQNIVEHGYGGKTGMKMFEGNANLNYFFLDSSYIRLIMIYGLLIALLVLATMLFLSIHSIALKDFALPAVLLVVTLSCLVEHHLMELVYNPFLLALLAKGAVRDRRLEVYNGSKKGL